MRLAGRLAVAVVLTGCATGAVAQSFNHAITRYRSATTDCAQAYRDRIERNCDAACQAAASARQARCLEAAEERYRAAIRRELRSRR